MRTRLLCVMLLVSVAGCGVRGDKAPLLTSLGAISATMNEIIDELEAGDLEAVDGVMHRQGFGEPFKALQANVDLSGLPEEAKTALLGAGEKISGELSKIHGVAHGGSIDDLDVPAITATIREALSEITGALPEGWTLPVATASTAGGDHDHEHDHDHDHDGEEHEGHDHDGHDHDGDDHAAEEPTE